MTDRNARAGASVTGSESPSEVSNAIGNIALDDLAQRPGVSGTVDRTGNGADSPQLPPFNLFGELSPISDRTIKRYKKTSEVEKIIPEFDGQKLLINQFIRDCKDAEKFVDPLDHDFFIRIVKSKVKGCANSYLQYKNFDTLDKLLDELK